MNFNYRFENPLLDHLGIVHVFKLLNFQGNAVGVSVSSTPHVAWNTMLPSSWAVRSPSWMVMLVSASPVAFTASVNKLPIHSFPPNFGNNAGWILMIFPDRHESGSRAQAYIKPPAQCAWPFHLSAKEHLVRVAKLCFCWMWVLLLKSFRALRRLCLGDYCWANIFNFNRWMILKVRKNFSALVLRLMQNCDAVRLHPAKKNIIHGISAMLRIPSNIITLQKLLSQPKSLLYPLNQACR